MRRLNMVSNTNWTSMTILLLGALTVMFGVQLLRTLFVGMAVYLTQVQEISPVLVGVLGLAVFLCGFLAPVVQRAIGPRYVLPVVVGLLSLAWLAEKFVSSLPADLGLSIAGTVLFLWSLPLLFRSIPTTGNNGTAAHAVIALLVGLSADTAIKGVFGTVDLSWAQGVAGYVAVAGLAGVQVFLLWRLASVSSRGLEQEPSASAWPYIAFGPALALQFLLFQNVAHQTVMIDWPQPAVYAWILAANLAGVAVAIELTRWDRNPPWPILGLLGGILVAIVTVDLSGFPAALIVLVGQVLTAVLLVSIVRASRESAVERSGRSISTWIGVGMIILLALLFIYYANYDTDVLVPKEAVRPLAALLIGVAALRAVMTGHSVKVPVTRFASIPALLLLILPLVALTMWKDVEPIQGAGYPVRVMSYNLHQGFDVHGSHGLEDIARVIQAEDPDIVALQEVSRGWVVNGSVDMLVWLSQRLEMDYVWGPAADPVWGNAVLSRLPIISSQNHRMPNNDALRLDRAFLTVEVDVGGGETIDVVATHIHSGDGDSAIRIPQAQAVLGAVDNNRTTVLLGDFNAHPDHPEMLLFADSGFNDTFVASGATGDGFTYPADNPWERIDYVWASPDLKVRDLSVPDSLASDHLAVAVTLYR